MTPRTTPYRILFPKPAHQQALGRNGWMNCTGLNIHQCRNYIALCPITSRNKEGRCQIELPSSPQVLAEVRDVLSELSGSRHPRVIINLKDGQVESVETETPLDIRVCSTPDGKPGINGESASPPQSRLPSTPEVLRAFQDEGEADAEAG